MNCTKLCILHLTFTHVCLCVQFPMSVITVAVPLKMATGKLQVAKVTLWVAGCVRPGMSLRGDTNVFFVSSSHRYESQLRDKVNTFLQEFKQGHGTITLEECVNSMPTKKFTYRLRGWACGIPYTLNDDIDTEWGLAIQPL